MTQPQRPNILFIFTDQQSATMLSAAGNRYVSTPGMDSIAARGVQFKRAYCGNPMCVPSRFSLMTGRLPSEIGLRNNTDNHIDAIPHHIRQNGLGWLLRNAGYKTAYGGKVHLPKVLTPEDLGFDTISSDERDALADTCADFLTQPHDQPFFLVASFINPHDICHMAIRDFAETESEKRLSQPDRIELQEVDAALRLAEAFDRDDFFAWHCPPLPANYEIQTDEPEAISQMQARSPFKRKARAHYDEERWRLHRWVYARLTERVDAQIGRVLQALQDSGHAQNTLVIFTSDHGDMDASHRMEHKTAFYEEASRIPLLIAAPGMQHTRFVDTHLVSNGLDLLPTLCDYAGVAPPDDVQGASLRPLIEGQPIENWRTALPVESEIGRMIVTERYKYMLHDEGAHREQLIDLLTDPGEMRNAAGDPQHHALMKNLREAFDRVFSEHASIKGG